MQHKHTVLWDVEDTPSEDVVSLLGQCGGQSMNE